MGLTPQSLRSHNTKADFLFPGLHLLVLWNFAVAQPLFDLFSRTAEFFVLRQSPALDVVLFAILLSIVVPALGVLVVWGIRTVEAGLSVGLHLLLVGCLSAMLALQALQMLQTLPNISGIVPDAGSRRDRTSHERQLSYAALRPNILYTPLTWHCALSDPLSLLLSGLNAAVLVAR